LGILGFESCRGEGVEEKELKKYKKEVVTAAAPPLPVAGHRAATPNLHLPLPARR